MRYVFIDRLGAQAIWNLVDQIALRLVARGDEVVYYRVDDGRQGVSCEIPDGIEVVDVRVPTKTRPWQLYHQQKVLGQAWGLWLAQARPDVVHTHFCVPGVVARVVARRVGVPTIVSTQHETSDSMYPQYRWAVRWTLRYADAVVYVSNTVAASFRRLAACGLRPSRGASPCHLVIRNGIDVPAIGLIGRSCEGRDPGRLVCVGRLVPGKGHENLLRAMRHLLELHPGVHLSVVGGGPLESRLRRLVARLGIDSAVRFTGAVPHQIALCEMATAGVVVVPSTGPEGFGLVVAEAMALQTPVVASCIPAHTEIFGGANVRLCSPDPGSLATALAETLAVPEAALRRAQQAREWIEQHCSAERMASQYLRLYDTLASRRKAVHDHA